VRKSNRPILVACVSDVHAGGTTALCPDKITLDDGGEYHASKSQRWLMQCWKEYWARVDDMRTSLKAELYAVFNGDAVEGDHHKTTQIMSANPNAQAAAWNAAVSIPLSLKPDRIVIVRGTEAHVGQSASSEERIADGLRRDKRPIISDPETGAASWWHWRPELNGVRMSVTHHGKLGQIPRTRGSGIVLYAWNILDEHATDGDPYPHLCLRGHNHKKGDSGGACPVRVVATGAWQLGTSHVHKVQADSLADIHGAMVVCEAGEYEVKHVPFKASRPIWRPE
jgi:hypothetical protein